MDRTAFESLGDKHKQYESAYKRKFIRGLPTVVRLDGRAFHTFTKGLLRPYDERMSRCMIETTKFLVEKTHAAIGYTQSDEISLVLLPSAENTYIFDGEVQKVVSIFSSLASVKFNKEVLEKLPSEYAEKFPTFDARVIQYPSLELAAENLLWRECDATRNSLTLAVHSVYSHKECQNAGYAKKHDMLMEKGINWNDYPSFFKRGTYVKRSKVMKHLSEAELAAIPEKYRPTGEVCRSEMQELSIPPLESIDDKVSLLFG